MTTQTRQEFRDLCVEARALDHLYRCAERQGMQVASNTIKAYMDSALISARLLRDPRS